MGERTTKKDSLGDRMKWYERRYTDHNLFKQLPIIARLDGRAFSRFTQGMDRPFDSTFMSMMIDTTRFLVIGCNCRCGYTQSDEITLVFKENSDKDELFFAGKVQKMVSVLASMATAKFMTLVLENFPERKTLLPQFDCRVFQMPSEAEAVNCLIWREQDATRNSLQMLARHYYSHSKCFGKDSRTLHDMLNDVGVNWNDYPSSFKRGTYIRRKKVVRGFTADELTRLPPQHEALKNPDLIVERSDVFVENLPILSKIGNRCDVIFRGHEPLPILEESNVTAS